MEKGGFGRENWTWINTRNFGQAKRHSAQGREGYGDEWDGELALVYL